MKSLIIALSLFVLAGCESLVVGTSMVRVIETHAGADVSRAEGEVVTCRVETGGTITGVLAMVYKGEHCTVTYSTAQ